LSFLALTQTLELARDLSWLLSATMQWGLQWS